MHADGLPTQEMLDQALLTQVELYNLRTLLTALRTTDEFDLTDEQLNVVLRCVLMTHGYELGRIRDEYVRYAKIATRWQMP